MVGEGDKVVVLVGAGLEVVVATRTIRVVLHVLLARPDQLDRDVAGLLRDRSRFDSVVVVETAAEATAAADHVDRDLGLVDAERRLDQAERAVRAHVGTLCRRPDFNRAVCLRMSRAVHRLERGVDEERIDVVAFERLRGGLQRGSRIANLGKVGHRCALGEFGCLGVVASSGLVLRDAFVPRDFQLGCSVFRGPPVVGHDGDAIEQAHLGGQVADLFDDEAVNDSGHRLDLGRVGRDDRSAEHRGFFVVGELHAFDLDVDAEDRLAADDLGRVPVAHGLADEAVVFRVFQLERCKRRKIRRGQLGGVCDEIAIGNLRVRGGVDDDRRFGGELFHRLAEARGSGLDQHQAGGGAHLAHRVPVLRGGERAARDLAAAQLGIGIFCVCVGLFDGDLGPVGVEFFGDQHGQHRLDALTDLGVLRHDADRAIRRDRYEHVHVDDRGGRRRRFGGDGGGAVRGVARGHASREHQAATGSGCKQEEAA